MEADGNILVPLRQKTKKKSQGFFIMSRRRISCKELGQADCQGWLYKKKEKGAFIGNKWKKFWCVLKESSLYWYSSQLAEKAEGFIRLPDFSVDRAIECKKKHAIKISHPQIKTFYFAAENVLEMNTWLSKLGMAVDPQTPNRKNEEECYSESEHDDPEITDTPPPPYTVQTPPLPSDQQKSSFTSTLSSEASCSLSSPESTFNSQESSSSLASKVVYSERQSWLDLVNSSGTEEGDQPLTFCVQIHSDEAPEVVCGDAAESQEVRLSEPNDGSQTSYLSADTHCLAVPDATGQRSLARDQDKRDDDDEMERLYKSLEQASLSPIGDRRLSTKKELRKSFIKRSKNPSINEKLHKIRMLNSTLKCKEHDLATINQLLEDPKLTAVKYREWRSTNIMLVQDIYQQQEVQDMSTENSEEQELTPQPVTESAI
ncbi:interactor protein for cytohesin exchange factors 1 isoform X4 [Haemorhous mexicanus]|uniref:interactor protein for cytohesin exchange factors 1 isoform X4 n=1 Tax=Haemorhous mexicanus TaxID=30427 RepID=UPI0028BEFAB3|nr:interactor protein for cytohesin exchange factors 1 isoform X4 [Haemorhous mexicanus]